MDVSFSCLSLLFCIYLKTMSIGEKSIREVKSIINTYLQLVFIT